MKQPARPPRRLQELKPEVRKFLASLDDDELDTMAFFAKKFSKADLQVLAENMENLRAMKRFGKAGLWVAGALIALAGAIAALREFLPRNS